MVCIGECSVSTSEEWVFCCCWMVNPIDVFLVLFVYNVVKTFIYLLIFYHIVLFIIKSGCFDVSNDDCWMCISSFTSFKEVNSICRNFLIPAYWGSVFRCMYVYNCCYFLMNGHIYHYEMSSVASNKSFVLKSILWGWKKNGNTIFLTMFDCHRVLCHGAGWMRKVGSLSFAK